LYNLLSTADKAIVKNLEFAISAVVAKVQSGTALSTQQRQRLNALSLKIEGRGEGE